MEDERSAAGILFPDELKEYVDAHPEGSYTLLDVRQPVEYEEGHLPGALLVPLPVLVGALERLDARKPVIVYCRVGGRSRMAAQLLVNHGFGEVYHLEGGIDAWEERTATGPREFHLRFIRGDASPEEVIGVAMDMEEGLRQFHARMQERSNDPELRDVLKTLVKAEEGHERALKDLLAAISGTLSSTGEPTSGLMEGGIDIEAFLEQNEPFMRTVRRYLDVAMMVETQALDLYLRMGRECRNPRAREVLFRIADEEKGHLAMLGKFLDDQAVVAP